jgi:cell division FtsZ-interacting protein ZapD
MEEFTVDALGEWESEGGAPAQLEAGSSVAPATTTAMRALTGTVNQIDWAEQIRERVSKDFDRVANAVKSVAAKQVERDQSDTEALIAILEEKRAEVMEKEQAGYFIHDWQEPGDQVRQMIVKDARYGAIKTNQAARKRASKINSH